MILLLFIVGHALLIESTHSTSLSCAFTDIGPFCYSLHDPLTIVDV